MCVSLAVTDRWLEDKSLLSFLGRILGLKHRPPSRVPGRVHSTALSPETSVSLALVFRNFVSLLR